MSDEWDGARGCLLQAIDDLENMYGASDTEVLRGLREILNGWIDPQRIVNLTMRFQDQEGTALVALWFSNHDPSFGEPQWTVELPSGRTVDGKTAADALNGAEA